MSDSDQLPMKTITVSRCHDVEMEVVDSGLLMMIPEAPDYDFTELPNVMEEYSLPQEVPDWFRDGYTQGPDGHWRPTHLVIPPGGDVPTPDLLETPIPGAFVFMATVLAVAAWSLRYGRKKT